MKIIVLAAGEGKRMRPLTLAVPKPLLYFHGKPILLHLFDALPPEITEIIMVVKYRAEDLVSFIGHSYGGKPVHYVEGSLDGNAIGFVAVKSYMAEGERFAVAYGDELITDGEMRDCFAHQFSWLCYEKDNPTDVGVALTDTGGRITEILEKHPNPPTRLVADGFMVTSSDIFEYTPEAHTNGEYYFSALMARFCQYYPVVAVKGDPAHRQFTTPEDLEN